MCAVIIVQRTYSTILCNIVDLILRLPKKKSNNDLLNTHFTNTINENNYIKNKIKIKNKIDFSQPP